MQKIISRIKFLPTCKPVCVARSYTKITAIDLLVSSRRYTLLKQIQWKFGRLVNSWTQFPANSWSLQNFFLNTLLRLNHVYLRDRRHLGI